MQLLASCNVDSTLDFIEKLDLDDACYDVSYLRGKIAAKFPDLVSLLRHKLWDFISLVQDLLNGKMDSYYPDIFDNNNVEIIDEQHLDEAQDLRPKDTAKVEIIDEQRLDEAQDLTPKDTPNVVFNHQSIEEVPDCQRREALSVELKTKDLHQNVPDLSNVPGRNPDAEVDPEPCFSSDEESKGSYDGEDNYEVEDNVAGQSLNREKRSEPLEEPMEEDSTEDGRSAETMMHQLKGSSSDFPFQFSVKSAADNATMDSETVMEQDDDITNRQQDEEKSPANKLAKECRENESNNNKLDEAEELDREKDVSAEREREKDNMSDSEESDEESVEGGRSGKRQLEKDLKTGNLLQKNTDILKHGPSNLQLGELTHQGILLSSGETVEYSSEKLPCREDQSLNDLVLVSVVNKSRQSDVIVLLSCLKTFDDCQEGFVLSHPQKNKTCIGFILNDNFYKAMVADDNIITDNGLSGHHLEVGQCVLINISLPISRCKKVPSDCQANFCVATTDMLRAVFVANDVTLKCWQKIGEHFPDISLMSAFYRGTQPTCYFINAPNPHLIHDFNEYATA